MARLVKIGNSQGIRIPKPLVEQAQLEGTELKLLLVSNGLLVSPEKQARAGREKVVLLSKEAFDKMSARAPKAMLVSELSDDDLRNIKQAKVPKEHAELDNELP